ncbi:nuclear transport factor 2 family protein [Streptosporangium canum]|uniref:nuclear transport factor 2 family protein n=1 Tax=Streptosporangium canum TaxID=324952 RepID=UPI0034432526
MADRTLIDELHEAEQRLQAAQLAGDVEELDRLLDEQLVFTGPPDCGCYPEAKQLDLHNHRSQTQVMTKLVQEDLTVLVEGSTGVTCFPRHVGGHIFSSARWRAHSPERRSPDGCATPEPGSTRTSTADAPWPPTPARRDDRGCSQ